MFTPFFHAATTVAVLAGASASSADSVPADSVLAASAIDTRLTATASADTARRRPRAIEYSDRYYRRLTVHR